MKLCVVVNRSDLFEESVCGCVWFRTVQPMNTVVDISSVSSPTGQVSTRHAVFFDYRRFKTVLLTKYTQTQSADTTADNQYFIFFHKKIMLKFAIFKTKNQNKLNFFSIIFSVSHLYIFAYIDIDKKQSKEKLWQKSPTSRV